MSTDFYKKRVIDLSVEELAHVVKEASRKDLEEINKKIEEHENALALQAPSFDRKTAAKYIGGKSTAHISNLIHKYNLPLTQCGAAKRILKTDLDHFLKGGQFDSEGNSIPITQNKKIKLLKNS
jgi:hypothetical protein